MKLNFWGFFLALFLLISRSAYAQPSWEPGVFAGASGYMGDINPVKFYDFTDPAFGVFVKRNFDGYWSLKFEVLHGKIQADDANSDNAQLKSRNLNFYSPLTEIGFQVQFNFFNYIPATGKRRFSPYLFTGLGAVKFNPKTMYNDTEYELNLLGTEGQDLSKPYKTVALAIPYGAGVKYNIAGNFTLGAEVGYRTAFTDYLDDVSGTYAPVENLEFPNNPGLTGVRKALADRSTPRKLEGTQRGDFRKHDTYMFVGLTLSYAIFSQKCPLID